MAIYSEWDLIKGINELESSQIPVARHRLVTGIGDDCAVYTIDENRLGLFTTDISIEHIHFDCTYASPFDIGHKAMAANLSDIAAMGGSAHLALISLGIPSKLDTDYILDIYKGFHEVSHPYGLRIAGGDISKSSQLIVNIALYGEVGKDDIIMRSGARIGDTVYVTGDLGGSLAGYQILTKHMNKQYDFSYCVRKHLCPGPRLDIIEEIKKICKPHAMIDISDGLLSDLRHICNASDTGFTIDFESLPVHDELNTFSRQFNQCAQDLALHSGEEYQLLFTAPDIILNDTETLPVHKIGHITRNGFKLSRQGKEEPVIIKGYEHFKSPL